MFWRWMFWCCDPVEVKRFKIWKWGCCCIRSQVQVENAVRLTGNLLNFHSATLRMALVVDYREHLEASATTSNALTTSHHITLHHLKWKLHTLCSGSNERHQSAFESKANVMQTWRSRIQNRVIWITITMMTMIVYNTSSAKPQTLKSASTLWSQAELGIIVGRLVVLKTLVSST